MFFLKVSLNELTNNQSETKAKINSQTKLCP